MLGVLLLELPLDSLESLVYAAQIPGTEGVSGQEGIFIFEAVGGSYLILEVAFCRARCAAFPDARTIACLGRPVLPTEGEAS